MLVAFRLGIPVTVTPHKSNVFFRQMQLPVKLIQWAYIPLKTDALYALISFLTFSLVKL
jgi:hypothetical protein